MKISNFEVFDSEEFPRIKCFVDESGEIWFFALDITAALGYINGRDALIKHVDQEDKWLIAYKDYKDAELAKEIKEEFPDKTIWMYTGDTYEDIKDELVMEYVDILIEGEYIEDLRDVTLPWKGSSNQRVVDVKASREAGEVELHA